MRDSQVVTDGETFDWTEFESPSAAVVTAVSSVSGTGSTDLDPLYTAIDPDALDAIFAPDAPGHGTSEGRVTFTYAGYRIVVKANGRCYVSEGTDDAPVGGASFE